MKKLIPALLICLLYASCKRALTVNEKKLCGRWVTTDLAYNREWFTFKQDGTFIDNRFPNAALQITGERFTITDNKLSLQYRTLVLLHQKTNYLITTQTDSTLIISLSSKRFGNKTYHLKKMKLYGKFIVV